MRQEDSLAWELKTKKSKALENGMLRVNKKKETGKQTWQQLHTSKVIFVKAKKI